MSIPLKTVAIADDDPASRLVLESALREFGYELTGTAQDGLQAVQLVQRAAPHVILVDLHMPVLDGMEAGRQIIALNTTAVIILTGDPNITLARQALDMGVCGYLQKPMDLTQLPPAMESAWHSFQTVHSLQEKMKELSDTLETRKLLERAKGILMEQQGFNEETAHRMLQKMSQDQGVSIKEICRSVIQVKLVLGKASQRTRTA